MKSDLEKLRKVQLMNEEKMKILMKNQTPPSKHALSQYDLITLAKFNPGRINPQVW